MLFTMLKQTNGSHFNVRKRSLKFCDFMVIVSILVSLLAIHYEENQNFPSSYYLILASTSLELSFSTFTQ